MKTKAILLLFATLITAGMQAQDTVANMTLSLQEAVDFAMQNNKNLENARQEIDKSDKGIWAAISQGLPQVDATLDYMTYFNYELAFSFGGGGDYTQEEINAATATVLGRSPYSDIGMTPVDLLPHYAASEIESELVGEDGATIVMSDAMTAKLQASQLVFSGQYIVGIKTAKLARMITQMAYSNSEIDTKEAVINAYYLTLITEASLDMIDKNLQNLEKMLNQTRIMHETGMAEELDVDQFKVTVNQLENTKRSMERNLQLNYNMLRFTLGVAADTEIKLTDNLDVLFEEMQTADLLLQEFNMESNNTYKLVKSQEEIDKQMLDLEKWNCGPTIAAFYNYNFKIMTTNFDMNPKHLAGFNLSLPILSSGGRAAKISQAKIQYEISQRNTEILGDQLKLQNSQLKYELKNSLENYYTQKENLDVAQRVLENYHRKYQQGMASSLDVTQANSSYLEAQSNFLSAQFEVMNARISLEKLMNNLSTL